MAREAAGALATGGEARAVWLVPIAWRLAFPGDASAGLSREIGRIERGLGLPQAQGPLGERFAALMGRLLARQCERLGLGTPQPGRVRVGREYFAAQAGGRPEHPAAPPPRHRQVGARIRGGPLPPPEATPA